MKWALVLVVALVGCAEDRVGIQFTREESRTVEGVNAEGSCGCPAGHALYCDGRDGTEVMLVDSCEIRSTADEPFAGFFVRTFSTEVEVECDFDVPIDNLELHDARAREVMFCNPI